MALRLPGPLSWTTTVIGLVVPPWYSVGRQVSRPLVALIVTPAGAPAARLQVSVCTGRSPSVAAQATLSNRPSSTVSLVIVAIIGALLTSLTMSVKVSVALFCGTPLSRTRQVMVFVLGPSPSLVSQCISPVAGLNESPGGPLMRLKTSASSGKLPSVTVGVSANSVPSSTVRMPTGVITGAKLVMVTLVAVSGWSGAASRLPAASTATLKKAYCAPSTP